MKTITVPFCAMLLAMTPFFAHAEDLNSGTVVHHVIIDTDTGSDDASALIMAGSSENLDILGITVLYGNVPLDQATRNAMMTMEICGLEVPVCAGAINPLCKLREQMISVHGSDGMGDQDLIHPEGAASEQSAVSFMLEQIKAHPDEVEIVALGPLTNIAQALLTDPETMSHVRRIWVMGTTGFGHGNATPVAEFNVYSDPDAYMVVFSSGLPITVTGLDCMVEGTGLTDELWNTMLDGNEKGQFAAKAFTRLLAFYHEIGSDEMGLPDPLAMATLIWPDYVLETVNCYAEVCTIPELPGYGQVIFYIEGATYEAMPDIRTYNIQVVTKVDAQLFMDRFIGIMTE